MANTLLPRIHPTAVISAEAELPDDIQVGPYVIIEGPVRLGPGCVLRPHVHLCGPLTMGRGNIVFTGAVLGERPQHLKYNGEPTTLEIGDENIFREHVTVHRGTALSGKTQIGSRNFLMSNCHVAHDCRIGNTTIIAGGALLAGWVEVGDRVLVSGNCVVHQYTRIGRLAMMRGLSRTSRDVPPFCIMDGTHTLRGINVIGLKRAGVPSKSIHALRNAFTALFGTRQNLKLAVERFTKSTGATNCAEVVEMLDFIRASKRGVAFGPLDAGASDTDNDPED